MKLFHLLTIVILCFALPFYSCKNSEKNKIRNEARESLPQVTPGSNAPIISPNTPATTPVTNNNEPHYKCPNSCVGGVGAGAGNCPVCGTAMAHNQAFHGQSASPTTITPPTPTLPTTPLAQPSSPAQNASGVYHYTCSSGCAGGAAGAGNCATCGNALAHNQAYHN